MSLLVFPTVSIPGFSVTCTRSKIWKTFIAESTSGKEWRTTHWSSPRDKLEFQYEFLRNDENYRELNRVFDFFSKHGGQWDSFFVEDPDDKFSCDQYLGSGLDDGVVTDPPTYFQLQRALRTSVEGRRDGGESSGHPIFNLATASHRFSRNNLAPWTASIPWALNTGAFIQDFADKAPDGTMTAARFGNGNTSGRDVNITHGTLVNIRENQVSPAGSYSFSIWVRALAMDGSRTIGLQFGDGTGADQSSKAVVVFGNASVAEHPTDGNVAWVFTLLDTNWTRIGIWIDPADGPEQLHELPIEYGVFLPQPNSEILIWGAQLESGAQRFSQYVAAMDSTAEVYGIYGAGTEFGILEPPISVTPAIGSGSEPVHYARPCAASEFGERYPGVWGAGQYQIIYGNGYGGTGLAPSASALDWQGKRAPHAGMINFIRFSQDFNQSAAWTAAAAGTGTAPTFATLRATAASDYGDARGPDGSKDHGTAIVFNVGAGTTSGDTSSITQTVDHPLLVQGEQYTFSVWMFPWKDPVNNVPPSLMEIRENTSGASVIASLDRRRGIYASRHALTFTAGASCSITIRWRGDIAANTAATTLKVLTWGAQLERGPSAGWFLPTQAAAVMAAPEFRDNQPSIYAWDQGMHSFGTLLDPCPRVNLCNGSWSTGSGNSPNNPTGSAVDPTDGGTVSGTSFASGIPTVDSTKGYQFTTGSMLCSSIYVRAASTGSSTVFTFGLRRDTPSNTTTNTVDFDANSGRITRAGSRVVSAYAIPLPNRWFRLVMVSTWDNADTTQSPMVGATASCETYLHIVEPGRTVSSPFTGATWAGDYTILDGPSTNHPAATPGTVLFPGDLDWIPAANPPPLGQYYTWSGGYYKRMRFDGEEISAERVLEQIWTASSVSLISVKP